MDSSIISIPDSDTSACGGALNETFSPPKRRASNGEKLLPVTPKREVDTTMNATFTPEDNNKAGPAKTNNDTFSPVRETEEPVTKCATPLPVVAKSTAKSKTPKKKLLPEISVTETQAESPAVIVASAIKSKALPDINIVPATPDTRNLRRSMRTPAKAAAETPVVATRASTRRSTRAQATPSKAVAEKKTTRGRKSKKGAAEEPEPEEKRAEEEEAPAKAAEEPVKQTEAPDKEEPTVSTPSPEEEKEDDAVVSASVPENEEKEKAAEIAAVEEVTVAKNSAKIDTEAVPVNDDIKEEVIEKAAMLETKEEPVAEVKQEEASMIEEVAAVKSDQSLPEIVEPKRETVLSVSDEDEDPPKETVKDEPVEMVEDEQENEEEQEEEDLLEDEEEPMDSSGEFHAPMLSNDNDVLLKSIRKRSLSVTDMNPPLPKRNFRVQFNSPGNMEKTITEIDESLYLNFTKSFASSFSIPAVPAATTDNVTKKANPPARRKRSLSNAETPVDKLATLQFLSDKQKKDTKTTTGSATKKMPTPSPRKKMPNFAAIHQNIFQQMESLVDFKERKKERAQFLLTTAPLTPSQSTAIAKPTIAKPVNRGAIGKAKLREIKKPAGNPLKLKNTAIGRKPTVASKMSEKKLAAILQTTDVLVDTITDMEKQDTVPDSATELAKPEEVKENVTVASVPRTASKIKVPTVFSKDTAIKAKPLNVSASAISLTGLKNRSAVPAKPKDTPVKSATTLGAPQMPAKEGAGKPANSYKMVKGVRMNRRFELMMMHRNKSDKN